MAEQKKVADLIVERQLDLDLTNQDIATRIGYANQNVISMIKKGRTKLPIDKVIKMADALSVDRSRLMRLVMMEYMPEAYEAIVACIGEPITKNERVLLEVWRDSTNGEDPAIPENAIKGLHQGFQTVMSQQAAN
tara:strand:+ start:201 stop:605 length:405 start_codon:yes stop_codon:yes gene_type:complete